MRSSIHAEDISPSGIVAVVLAAGYGRRFKALHSKLVTHYRGLPLLRHGVEAALGSDAYQTIVVTGYDCARVEAALDGLSVTLVYNADYASGLASSLIAGVERAITSAGVLVLLGDMPGVSPEILNQLITVFQCAPPECTAVAPTFQGRRGNPVLIGQVLFPQIMQLRGDEGAQRLLRTVDGVIELPIDNDAVTKDIDTFADLESLCSREPLIKS